MTVGLSALTEQVFIFQYPFIYINCIYVYSLRQYVYLYVYFYIYKSVTCLPAACNVISQSPQGSYTMVIPQQHRNCSFSIIYPVEIDISEFSLGHFNHLPKVNECIREDFMNNNHFHDT